MIICANPQAQFFAQKDEILSAVGRTLESNSYVLGPEVAAFEAAFSAYCDSNYAVGVNSGTDALILSMRALSVGSGDEVITVSHTALATVSAILAVGAKPVLVDVDPTYYTIDVQKLKMAITPKTKALVAVHLYGQTADMKSLIALAKDHKLFLIEDCAQATGARYEGHRVGSLGDIGCFSFYPTKNLGAIGDGGMVVTKHHDLYERVQRLRQYGWDDLRKTKEPGLNSRLDEVQAAILNVKLKKLDIGNSRRRAIAKQYSNAFRDLPLDLPQEREKSEHVFHLYVMATQQRDQLRKHLAERKIMTGIHYPVPVHKHGGYDKLCAFIDSDMKETLRLTQSILSLPMYPELTPVEVETVISEVRDYFRNEM